MNTYDNEVLILIKNSLFVEYVGKVRKAFKKIIHQIITSPKYLLSKFQNFNF